MTINLLLKVQAPTVARRAADVQSDLRQLILDGLQTALQRNPNFQLRLDLMADQLHTKADVARHLQISFRTVERYVRDGKLPQPIRVSAAHCTNGAPRWRPEDIAAFEVPIRAAARPL